MKLLKIWFWLALSSSATAQYQNLTDIQLATPACARNCSLPSISGLTCRPTTVKELADCVCPDSYARRKITACVQKSCSYTDLLLAGRPSSIYCAPYPVPSRGEEIKRAAIVLLAVTIPFILLRIWSRGVIMRVMWWDDYTLAVASVVLISWLAMYIYMVPLGFGKHVWHVSPQTAIPLSKMFFAARLFYILVQFGTKLSILFCYLRIFPQRLFRLIALTTFYVILLKGVAYLFVIVFRCSPINANWDRSVNARCLDGTSYVYAGAVFSIVEDLWILALPIPVLKSLKIPRGKKIGVAAMFGIGILACITSMIRLKFIANYGSPVDPTWDNIDLSLWSLIENSVAVICASVPGLRPLLSRLFPSVFGTMSTNPRSKGAYGYGIQDTNSKRSARKAENSEEVSFHDVLSGRSGGSRSVLAGSQSRKSELFGKDGGRHRERELDGDETSGSSFNFATGEESQDVIRMERVFEIKVSKPKEGHTRTERGCSFS